MKLAPGVKVRVVGGDKARITLKFVLEWDPKDAGASAAAGTAIGELFERTMTEVEKREFCEALKTAMATRKMRLVGGAK